MKDPEEAAPAYPTEEQIEEVYKAWQREGKAGIGAYLMRQRERLRKRAAGQETAAPTEPLKDGGS